MRGIRVIDKEKRPDILDSGIAFLNKYISDNNIVGYTVFGSVPRGTFSEDSDIDVKIYFKYPADDMFLRESFKIDIPKERFIRSSDSGFDVYQSMNLSYEIKNAPLWHVSEESLLGSMKSNKIHDLTEILYGMTIDTFTELHNNILSSTRDRILNDYIWPDKGLVRHGTGQTLSQIKKAEELLTKNMENRVQIAKKITTSFYILGNILSIIDTGIWYRNFFQMVDNLPETLIDMVEPMNKLGSFLRDRTNKIDMISIEGLINNIRLMIDSVDSREFSVLSNDDIKHNSLLINDIIMTLYQDDLKWNNCENIKI